MYSRNEVCECGAMRKKVKTTTDVINDETTDVINDETNPGPSTSSYRRELFK